MATDANQLTRPSGPGSSTSDPTWWRQAVVYQIYPRSFADASADGIGDLQGIVENVGHLRRLGVDAVWLSPFYPSAVAPELGTLDEFDALVTALRSAGIKLIVDIVPNHTSNRHAWFREALAAPPGSVSRARYVIRRGRGADPDSTLSFVAALAARRDLLADEGLTWVDSAADVVAFERPGEWVSMTNFGATPVDLPTGEVVVSSGPLDAGRLPGSTTAWVRREARAERSGA